MKIYATLLDALNDLRERGYVHDFNLRQDCIYCHGNNAAIKPDEFHIVETYRFEGMSDPDDNSIIYAIESSAYGIKGVLINAYGIYSDEASSELVKKFG